MTTSVRALSRIALEIYASLSVDWPTGTILKRMNPDRYSDRAIADFLANVGSILATLPRDQQMSVARYTKAAGVATWWYARERHRPKVPNAREEKIRAQKHARRLRRRRACVDGLLSIDEQLAGALPRQQEAAWRFVEALSAVIPEQEAIELARRWQRVSIPRF